MAVPSISRVSLGDLDTLSASWHRALRAQNKSPRTVQGYLEGVRLFGDFLRRERMPTDVAALEWPGPPPPGAEWVEAYRAWLRGGGTG